MAARCDILFLCDIFTKLNDLNKLLQGNRKTLVDCKSFITTIILKLMLYKINISKCQFHQFPQLVSLKDELVDEDLTTHRNYLQLLHDNMVGKFQDDIAVNIPNWCSNQFEVDAFDCEDDIQEELIELQNDNDATMQYHHNGKESLWYHQSILDSYPSLWRHLKLLLLAFPTSYLVESSFNHVGTLFSHKRTGLVSQRRDLQLKSTSLISGSFGENGNQCKIKRKFPEVNLSEKYRANIKILLTLMAKLNPQ
ncbi:Hypothetical predicted protein [Octopus vulgaris]|uniref:HAT C-terminal dimerisation domain-containing protein n=1 Tax=Octopus vulgaris TaxID=6645 RepID=A0AA36F2E0_OCTVU|nr:Hypothetical predicted protein [Octopus vulgaris]